LDKHLHIVTHDVPWPADFGGVVDLFYKIQALHKAGIKIHLHCFHTTRPEQSILNRYCESVHYYQRKSIYASLSLTIPYIVKSRNSEALLENLKKDNYPILLEGIHCTYWFNKGMLNHRQVFVRLHNVEYRYYHQLAKLEKNIIKKIYFRIESMLLKQYEKQLARKARFLCVSMEDALIYKNELGADKIYFLPVFLPWNQPNADKGSGSFCLYHGNLSVNENEKAAEWLLSEVFNELKIPFVIAGKSPRPALKALAHKHPHTCIVVNPSDYEMQDLIKKAQLNILPSFNNTGVKLKLLNAVFNGRHCLVNQQASKGTGLENICFQANDAAGFRKAIETLYKEPFTEKNMQHRSAALKNLYCNEENARQLIAWIY
jgi:glycosyltransferase involved in cell wall biosynthesis